MHEHSMPGQNIISKTEQVAGQSLAETKQVNVEPMFKFSEGVFKADRNDTVFALGVFALGYIFARWVLFSWQGWGVTMFSVVYCSAVTGYFLRKRVSIPRASWFWFSMIILLGLNFSLMPNKGLAPWRSLFLFCSGLYWIISVTGLPIQGNTSNWLVLDWLNGLLIIPFSNITSQYKCLALLFKKKKTAGKQVLSILLGLLLTLLVVALVMPLLLEADSGGFYKITHGLWDYLDRFMENFAENIGYVLLTIPISAYLFGLINGCAHKRCSDAIQEKGVRKFLQDIRLLPPATVYTLLGLVCVLYIVFIGSQLPYYVSAFFGERPEGWQVYSECARRGFFELCGIAAINLALLLGTNSLSQRPRRESLPLRIFNIILALLTIFLIATAFSKLALYINVYGLSIRRLLPCVFMAFLTVIYGGIIALQKWQFSIMRLAAVVGMVMLCILCFANPDGIVARYNAERYLAGTLKDFDVKILYQAGSAGVKPAIEVYNQTNDALLKDKLTQYLYYVEHTDRYRDNWQSYKARQLIKDSGLSRP